MSHNHNKNTQTRNFKKKKTPKNKSQMCNFNEKCLKCIEREEDGLAMRCDEVKL